MKKTLALILSLFALLIPVSALELDVAEADVAVEETAVLAAGAAVPTSVAKYDKDFGELIFFEDFEDGTAGDSYTSIGNNAYIWSKGSTVDSPLGDGKAFVSSESYTQLAIYGSNSYDATAVTLSADFLNYDSVTTHIPVAVLGGWLDPWNYWTNDQISTTEWTNKAVTKSTSSISLVTSSDSGNLKFYFGGKGMYVDNVKIYAKYDIGDRVRLVEGNDYTFINASETIPAPADTNLSWVDESGKVYNVGETAPAGTVLIAVAIAEKPAAVDVSKGFLVFFDNGNESDYYNNTNLLLIGQSAATFADGYLTRGIWNCNAYDAETNPTGFNTNDATHGIAVRTADGSGAAFADGTAMDGTISAYFEMYNGTSADKGFNSWSSFNPGGWDSWCGGYTAWGSSTITKTAVAGQWTTLGAKINASKGSIGLARSGWDNHNSTALDIRSAYVYYMPAKHVIIKDAGNTTLVDLNGLETYTLGTSSTGGWMIEGTQTEFAADATVNVADINGKTLVSGYIYDEKPADETDNGFLVYFFNGKESDTVKKVNITLNKNGLMESTYVDGHYLRGFDCNIMGCATHGGYIIAEDGEGFKFIEDGSEPAGDFVITWNVYSITGTGFYDFVICDNCNWDGGWVNGIETNWSGSTPVAKQWTKLTRAHHAGKGVSTIGLVEGGWKNESHMGQQGYGSVAVYYRPQARVSLTDGTAKNMYDLTGETSYTFPAEYNGNAVEAWKSGEAIYLAGAEVAVADIVAKTFTAAEADEYYAANYAPETEADVELRLTSNTATNGIRFKASIAPSKKAEADEIGFIVAREDILEYLDADLTFDLTAEGVENAEGTLFVKGVAYDAATGKDIVADTKEDGSEVFTGVCVGINIESKAQVTSVLVARPYLKMTVNEKEITVYGAANSASLAGAAADLKAAAESGDQDASTAYEGAKEYIDTVIATAE